MFDPQVWQNYALPPNVRRFMGMSDDVTSTSGGFKKFTESELEAFADIFHHQAQNIEPPSAEALVDLIEELVAMNLSGIAVRLYEYNRQIFPTNDADALIALGNAYLFAQEYREAEDLFLEAQATDPAHIIPYVNLGQIYFAEHRDDEALAFCEQGFEIDRDHRKLWELYLRILKASNRQNIGEALRSKAEQAHSWFGRCLALELTNPNDPWGKLAVMQEHFDEGERGFDFLIEYTGLLGVLEQNAKIPPIIWQLEYLERDKQIPWQLLMHSMQAHMALGEVPQGFEMFTRLQKYPQFPKDLAEHFAGEFSALKQ